MDDSNRAYGWRKGYPSEEMIAAHRSRLWLVKGKSWLVKELLSLAERIERNQLYVVVECTYKEVLSGEITIVDPSQYYKRGASFYDFYLFDNGDIIINEIYISESINDCGLTIFERCYDDLVFKGKWDGDSVKQIESRFKSVDFISHAETVLKLLQEQGKLKQTLNQKMYANSYFCPIDKDGNKVPWPKEIIVGTIDDASMYDAADPAGSLVVATVHIGE
jgi:hypothetical protein